ncbi:MAG TPA: surface-adhesin E family protein [Allosphingosinicella sp.]|nr:surface-adhesin E family protein [Allosphingosinicella sp.]
MSLLLAVMIAAQAPAAEATAWERVFQDAESTQYLDPASIRRDGAHMQVRWRFDFSQADGDDGMQRLIVNALVDCRARIFLLRRVEGYRGDGSPIQAFDLPPDHPQAAAQALSERDETTYRRVCGAGAR